MANLQGNSAKSFSGRIFEEHNDLQWRVDRPSTHYRAPDTPGSAFAFFTVAKALKSAPWEQIRLAEAAVIATINSFRLTRLSEISAEARYTSTVWTRPHVGWK